MFLNFMLTNSLINSIVFNTGNESGLIITELLEGFIVILSLIKGLNGVRVHF
ncbi:hypothetical protein SDC9_21876 [bioreactor metagenome]|uniref:Uncharacterized protein n=1 Tax=bioreactor metagenome TaxID=1076179 RepID=A0A644UAM6_9ZZZZ